MLIARMSDTVVGICTCANPPYPDVGVIIQGDFLHLDMGLPVARMGDTVTFSCGTSVIMTGTFLDLSAGQPVARMGDTVTGCGNGTIIAKSMNISV